MKTLRALAFIGLASIAAVAHAAATKWSIVEVGDPWRVFAESINNRGDVSGWTYGPTTVPMHHAFIWRNGVMEDLGVPAAPGWFETDGVSINNGGTVVANSASGGIAIWSNGSWTVTGIHGTAYDINEGGAITGGYFSPPGVHPFIYKDGVLTDLGTLGGVTAFGRAINNGGTVVGFSALAGSPNNHAFIYQDGAMHDLGTLGGANSSAIDVNNGGVVVGSSQDASGRLVAFVWDGAMRPLVPTSSMSYAMSINDRGDIVGNVDSGSFLYRDGVVTRLESIPEVATAGWTRLSPYSINDRGWITGIGTKGGAARAFVLMPK